MIRYSSLAAVVISAGILLSYMTGMFAISFVLTLIWQRKVRSILRPNIALLNQLWAIENIGMANGVIQALTIVAILFSSFTFLSSLKRIM